MELKQVATARHSALYSSPSEWQKISQLTFRRPGDRSLKVSLIMTGKGAGGLQQRLVLYSAALVSQGHTVQTFIHQNSPLIPNLLELGLKPEIVRFHCWSRWRNLSVPLMWWKLRRFDPDVVIGFAQKGLKAARKATGNRYPLLTHIGSLDPTLVKTLAIADGYFATSEQMIEVLVQVGVDSSKIRLLPNFLISPLQPPKKVAFVNPIRIGTMGRFVARKGFSTLLLAGKELQERGVDVRIILAGDGPERKKLQNEAEQLGMTDRVEFPGWLDDRSKKELLSKSDIFVCPSDYEPFGLVLIEAAQAGLPIVTTDTNGAKHIFRHGVDAIVSPVGDASAMAAEIEKIILNPAMAQNLADEASNMFKERFHVSSAAPEFISLLAEMTQNWHSSRSLSRP